MAQTGRFRYVHENGVAAIELPYAGDDLSMIAILPDGDMKSSARASRSTPFGSFALTCTPRMWTSFCPV